MKEVHFSEKFCLNNLNKKGQFFIMAAVILSILLFSLIFTVNEVISTERDNSFYDYTNDVERETKNIIDYQVYRGFESVSELDNFVDLLQNDFRDKAIDSNFMIIYGNKDGLTIKNIGVEGVILDQETGEDYLIDGASDTLESDIRIAGITKVSSLNFRNDDTTNLRLYTKNYITTRVHECYAKHCSELGISCDSSTFPSRYSLITHDTIKECVEGSFGGEAPDPDYDEAPDSLDEFFSGPTKTEIEIEFSGHNYQFNITESNQVIFIVQRNFGDEIYVDVR